MNELTRDENSPEQGSVETQAPAMAYVRPEIVTWSSDELSKVGTPLNACISYEEF